MAQHTIDTAMARRLVEASAIQGASIVGQPGGWSVLLKVGMTEKPLGTQRTDKPRTWRSLDTCVDYLRTELHIVRVDGIDASQYNAEGVHRRRRQDSADRLKAAHEAAAHDRWFREQVEIGLKEANDPATEWVSDDEARAGWAAKRAQLVKKAAA